MYGCAYSFCRFQREPFRLFQQIRRKWDYCVSSLIRDAADARLNDKDIFCSISCPLLTKYAEAFGAVYRMVVYSHTPFSLRIFYLFIPSSRTISTGTYNIHPFLFHSTPTSALPSLRSVLSFPVLYIH
jgi:hypothetical protein